MPISLLFVVASCLGAVAFAPTLAFAQQGHIGFSGSIVEPTCASSATDATLTNIGNVPRHMTCARAGSAAPARDYALSVTHLGDNPADRVLRYFATYVRATSSGTAVPVLLMKVYE
jgi:type 1 fimbria pilin